MTRCLCCQKPLENGETDFHAACAKRFFGSVCVPALPYTREALGDLAKQIVRAQTTIAGVQPKLSLALEKATTPHARLTIVGLWGKFILKPQTPRFPELPENEACTMHLANAAGIRTVPHSLIRFADGELCYISRRIDRGPRGKKIPMEDFCQILGRLSADKYKSSYEKIAHGIRTHSAFPGFDVVNFAEVVLFSWLTGNSDMHLKNFSLFAPSGTLRLAPAYDLLNVNLALPNDKNELALTLRGKTRRLTRNDFKIAFTSFGLNEKAVENIFDRFRACVPAWEKIIEQSFLSPVAQERYRALLRTRTQSFFA